MADTNIQSQDYTVWKTTELAHNFLEGVRGAIPLASVQIDCIIRLIKLTQTQVKSFLDLGCGNGILGRNIHQCYPQAKGVFADLSETMLQAARDSDRGEGQESVFILQDFGQKNWLNSVKKEAPFDVIVSGFAIHHQLDTRKKEIYQEIYNLLKPGGYF